MFYKGWTVNARIDILSEQMAVYVDGKGFVIEPGTDMNTVAQHIFTKFCVLCKLAISTNIYLTNF